jgi:A/G-specific adenine glycosylase
VKSPRREKRQEDRTVFVFSCDGRYALEKRPQKGLLAGLWQFPNVLGRLDVQAALDAAQEMGLHPRELTRQVERRHIFTHIRWDMTGMYWEVSEADGDFIWLTAQEINSQAALPTAFRQFWRELNDA